MSPKGRPTRRGGRNRARSDKYRPPRGQRRHKPAPRGPEGQGLYVVEQAGQAVRVLAANDLAAVQLAGGHDARERERWGDGVVRWSATYRGTGRRESFYVRRLR